MKKLTFTALLFIPFYSVFAQSVNKQEQALSIDTIASYLEHKHSVKIFFQPEWFKNKQFNSSILTHSVNEITDLLKYSCNCSVITIDSTSIVFIPLNSSANQNASNDNVMTIGNPVEFGKYPRATITGKIMDGKNLLPLSGAKIRDEKSKNSAMSDKSGNFSLTLPVGDHNLTLSYIGYEDNKYKVKLIGNGTSSFTIFEKSISLDEVVVTSVRTDNNLTNTQMSLVQLNAKDIKELPVTFGETDIIKSATLLPGVQTVGEFGTGFNVRGGSADQNLILIEDVPIFNTSHLFGLTSIINPDGVSNVTLLKAGIPAKYGERASSLMDIHLGNANAEKPKITGGIGLINSRLSADIPLLDNKINLMVGGRTTYSDWLLRSLPDIDLMNSSAQFYDLNTLLSISPDKNNKIIVFGYFSNDKIGFSHNIDYKYSNTLASLRWNHIFSQKLSASLMTGYSRYNYEMSELDTLKQSESYRINSQVCYNNIKGNMTWHPSKAQTIEAGANAIFYAIKPGDLRPLTSESLVEPISIKKQKANELSLYISDNINLTSKINAEIGTRYTWYTLSGPGTVNVYRSGYPLTTENIIDTIRFNKSIKRYSGLEPRISLRYSLDDFSSIKLSYNHINQYISLLSNTSVAAPTDVWKLSDTYLRPLKCDQYAMGYFRNFNRNAIETSVEIYYKTMKDIVECKDGAEILLNNHLETDLINAKGYSYGLELYVKKNSGRLTGWASYTYSRSMRKTSGTYSSEQINGNRWFPSNYDKPHNLVLNSNYHISRRWRFSASFTYNTGRPVTLPELKYTYNNNTLIYYSQRNKYRLPDYHRLDVSITLDESLRIKKKWKGSWTFSIINLYGRKNPYSTFYKKDTPSESNNYQQFSLYQLYILGRPLPTLTYNFSF